METKKTKKPTKADIERRMRNAIVLVPKDKDYSAVYLDDKGLRLEVTQDSAVIKTMFHTHVFAAFTTSGISRPYVYTKRVIEIANENDCIVNDNKGNKTRSMVKLLEVLKAKEDQTEYNVVCFYSWWLFNIFQPLYSIGETESEQFLVYEQYMHNIARSGFLLEEHKEDVTNKDFVKAVCDMEKSFIEDTNECVVLKAMTDEERVNKEMDALQQEELEKLMEEQNNG